jgi:hypothetical protein
MESCGFQQKTTEALRSKRLSKTEDILDKSRGITPIWYRNTTPALPTPYSENIGWGWYFWESKKSSGARLVLAPASEASWHCLTSFGRRRAKTARLLKIDFDSAGKRWQHGSIEPVMFP